MPALINKSLESGPLIVTGSRGRLASILADEFERAGSDVVRVSRTGGHGHILYSDLLESGLLARGGAVLHCACSSVPATAERKPERAWTDDLSLLARILAEVSKAPAEARPLIVFFSSGGTVYGERLTPATENDPLAPTGWYGIGKVAAENLLANFAAHSGLEICTLRVSNPYGFPFSPEKPQGIIGAAIHAIQTGRPLALAGGGGSRKDFLHMRDLWLAVAACVNARLTGTFNICSGTSVTMNHIIDLVESASGREVPRHSIPAASWDVQSSLLSRQKFTDATGWVTTIGLDQGIEEVVSAALSARRAQP